MICGSEVRIMYGIRIELQSNLCASSGDGYATTIDNDIVTDKLGIPYIPARRLKGCLRDAAVYIYGEKSDIVDKIFGISGDVSSGALKVENAKIEEYETFSKMCIENKLTANMVTDLFTDTFASTAVESNGAAKENSLRFLRYVSKNKAWNPEENLVFLAEAEIDDIYYKDFERICKALRHIGYRRNRGFGCVRCSIKNQNINFNSFSVPSDIDRNKDYTIKYIVKLDENVMLPAQTADETIDYISGQAVAGAFAGKYLKNHEPDAAFDELFLSGNVRFSNLYITNTKYQSFLPVPQIFGKTKQSNCIIDLTISERGTEIVKPLKSGYINSDLKVMNPLTERIYHNNLSNAEGGLYVQNCLQSGQLFRGTISGKGSYIRIILELLKDGKFSFGRSKTAQYSSCSLFGLDVDTTVSKKLHIQKGDKIVYLFESDVIIPNEYAGCSTDISSVCDALGIKEDYLTQESGLKYKTLSGYLSVMRLQRSHIRAIAAGSAVVVKYPEDTEIDEILYVGGRQSEGFGKIRAFKAGKLPDDEIRIRRDKTVDKVYGNEDMEKMFVEMKKDETMRNTAISYALDKKSSLLNEWNSAFIGRIILMLKQSESEIDFKNRIASIKSMRKRQIADSFLKDALNKWESDSKYKVWAKRQEYWLMILTLAKYFHKEKKGEATK